VFINDAPGKAIIIAEIISLISLILLGALIFNKYRWRYQRNLPKEYISVLEQPWKI
jgi:hypothetical protein